MAGSQETPLSEVERAGSPHRFGFEWHRYAELQAAYEEQFRRWTCLLSQEDWRGKRFLDVGCGMGRNSYWPVKWGAAEGVAIDLDDRSLAAARVTLAGLPVSVERMSAYDIAYRDAFDIVFSVGVIHHLAEPERALDRMAAAARPGGTVLVWVYGLENNRWIVTLFDPMRRALFSRLPIGLVHALSNLPAAGLWLALRLGLGRNEYFRLIRRFSYPHLRSIVFDQMLPRIAHYWPREKVEQMLREAGLEDVRVAWVNEISWCAAGRKPAMAPSAGGSSSP